MIRAYLAYFGVNGPAEWQERYANFLQQTAFRTSPTFQSKVGPLSVWLRQGEIEAAQVKCAAWAPKALRNRLQEIKVLCKAKNPAYFLPRMRELCAEVGIAVVFVRVPAGCAASGATRFVFPNKAMVILSFRYLSDDHFWFTFFHEIGHLLLHKSDLTFIDGEERSSNKIEKEANEFSERLLTPEHRREEFLALQLPFCFEVGLLSDRLVGSAPE